jgi:hypothetical protein
VPEQHGAVLLHGVPALRVAGDARRRAGTARETRQEFREVLEGGVPGLPEPDGAGIPELPLCDVEKFPGALGDPVLGIAEEKRGNQLRVGFVCFAEGGYRVAEQVLQLRDPAVPRAAHDSRVISGQLLQVRRYNWLLIVRADVEAFDPPLAAGGEFFG